MVAEGCSDSGIWQGLLHGCHRPVRHISSLPFRKGKPVGEQASAHGTQGPPAPHLVPAVSPEQPVGPDIEDLICPWVLQDEAVTLSLEHVGTAQLASLRGLSPLHRHPEGVHCGDRDAQGRAEEGISPAPGEAAPCLLQPR